MCWWHHGTGLGMLRWQRGERGFTLVETLAAIVVFFIVTLGVLPLINGAIRGSGLARSLTLGKGLAETTMERIRGLPYHNSRTTQRLDVLDFYYPAYRADGSYETVCPDAAAPPGACPANIPPGYQVEITAAFVKQSNTGTPEVYDTIVIPTDTYVWNGANNKPPDEAQYVRIDIESRWTLGGIDRDFQLDTLVGDRKSGALSVDGAARVEYFLRVGGSFNINGSRSDMTATLGGTESRIESRLLTTADQIVTSGTLRIADSNPVRQFTDVESSGETGSASAPPDTNGAVVPAGAVTLTHPQPTGAGALIATLGDAVVSNLRAQQSASLPIARGQFEFIANGLNAFMSATNQADTTDAGLRLASGVDMVRVTPSGTGGTLFGATEGLTTPIGAGRKVQTTATLRGTSAPGSGAGTISILPARFTTPVNGPVVEVSNFRADVSCPSTGVAATSTPTATWSATLRYWKETNEFDNVSAGSYVPVETTPGAGLSGSPNSGAPRVDPLAALVAAPPMVHEFVDPLDPTTLKPYGSEKDTYLFPVQHNHSDVDGDGNPINVSHTHPGYLSSWSSLPDTVTSRSPDWRSTAARIEGALRITTTPTSPLNGVTSLNISIGSLSCQALDRRL